MKCPNCGKDLSAFSPGSAYCPYCGQALGDQVTNRLLFCPYCGQELLAQAAFCPHCGKKLVLTKAKPGGYRGGMGFVLRVTKSLARSIRGRFGREGKIKKLYQQWAEFSELPPDEVPSMEDLRQKPAAEKGKKQSPHSDTS